jgi:hypothetical protein
MYLLGFALATATEFQMSFAVKCLLVKLLLLPHCGSGVDSDSNRNDYQKYFLGGKGGLCVRLTTLSPSCADCLKIWEPQPPGTLRAYPGLLQGLLYLYLLLRFYEIWGFS